MHVDRSSRCLQCAAELPGEAQVCPHCGAPCAPDPRIGQTLFGRYRVVRALAEGGMGRVYLAEQSVGTVTRPVAVKVLRPDIGSDPRLAERFAREAETLVRLAHPNIVQLFDFGALPDGTLALAMEYVEGRTLRSELSHGPIGVARVERITAQICSALGEAHAHGIVHRDLKPDNLLITSRVGQEDFVKVLDFGIAKASLSEDAEQRKLTLQGMMVGTPAYMSPEQVNGDVVDARSDLYSLALIVYEMLSGERPFEASTSWQWAAKHMTAEPRPLPLGAQQGLTEAHASALRRALSKRPAERQASAQEFLASLTGRGVPTLVDVPPRVMRTLVDHGDPPSVVAAPSGEAMRSAPSRSGWRAFGLGIALGSCLLAVLAFALRSRPGEQPAASTTRASTESVRTAALPAMPDPLPMPTLPASSLDAEAGLRPRAQGEHERAESGSPSARRARRPQIGHESQPVAHDREESVSRAEPAPPAARRAKEPEVSADLSQRIARIRAALAGSPELAVAHYQAAMGLYGSHSALRAVRTELAQAGESRIRQLAAARRCPQAQALFRALSAISAAPHDLTLPGCALGP